MFSSFKHVAVTGVSVVLPSDEICIYDEAQYYENNIKRIDRMRKKVGFYKRRVVKDDIAPADLAIAAAKKLFDGMQIDPSSIDGLIYVVQKQTYPGMVDAYYIHNELGLSDECSCANVAQGCAGWVWGVQLCSQMISSGCHKRMLLLNADTPSVEIDPADRNSAPIFGDGGSATLIEYCDEDDVSYFGIRTQSSGYDKIIRPAGRSRLRVDYDKPFDDPYNAPLFEKFTSKAGYETTLLRSQLDGDAVFEFTMNEVPRHITDTIAYSGISKNNIAKCCLHQANKQIVQTIAQIAGFPLEDTPYDAFENYGNNTMCSIPTVLCEVFADNKYLAIGGGKYILCCGFGNGLVIATALLKFDRTFFAAIGNYARPDGFRTREQWIEYWKNKAQGK